ncbi:MAG: tRNA (N(6)-L-threonylcarbamoyladenosine(37)-C(2))-methylthiotransferase MtaB [Coriobacteriia bacterium]|nr:tRNA (N(6)-L-threonylcarbamoyladenosine(37)-C(2))-methylthiotransferase MtaB [Coriobacteriia bacterium]
MSRYFIKTFGCKVNQVESDDLRAALAQHGMQHVSDSTEANFVIVNTCTVTGEADRKVRKELRKSARLSNVSAVLVTGCLANLNSDKLESSDEKIKVVSDQALIPDILVDLSSNLSIAEDEGHDFATDTQNPSKNSSPEQNDVSASPIATPQERIRVPVKVQDGCEDFCSYCIVPFARGGCSSVSADKVIAKIQQLAELGTKEAVLTGINLGNYTDLSDSGCANIPQLLRRIQIETDMHRIRLSSIEPRHITDELLGILAEEDSILCEHLHIPLQSGSDYVLGDMNRNYTAAEFLKTVEKIRKAKAHTAITTDIIVGYPNESEEDFQATLELAQKVSFAKTHIFRYSSREGTAAAKLKPLNPELIKSRAQTLQKQASLDALRYQESRVGQQLELVIESTDKKLSTITGTTREYLRLTLPSAKYEVGDLALIEY